MIFLTILKIIGIILLVLLIIILALLAIILFVPIRYRLNGNTNDIANIHAKVTWILHIISFRADWDKENSLCYHLNIFGIKVYPKDAKPKRKAKNKDNNKDRNTETIPENKEQKEEKTEELPILNLEDTEIISENSSEEPIIDTSSDDNKKKRNKKPKGSNLKNKLNDFKTKFSDTKNNISSKYKKWKKIIKDQRNKTAVSFLKEQLLYLLDKIKPNKLFIKGKYSTGSPDTTAEVFGIIAFFPIYYQNKWQIEPDFEAESFYLNGKLQMKGKIRLIYVLIVGAKVYFNKNCRRLYKMLSK